MPILVNRAPSVPFAAHVMTRNEEFESWSGQQGEAEVDTLAYTQPST